MLQELTEKDFVPLADCQFQHWGDRAGPPYSHIRPLSESSAERLWARAGAFAGATQDSSDSVDAADRLDLSLLDDWDAAQVTRWLSSRVPDVGQRVLVCYQPKVAVSVPWGAVCEHWLVFFWTGAWVLGPDGDWTLVHDGDRFVFDRKPVRPRA